jgi:AcrR family transcriptional regulator
MAETQRRSETRSHARRAPGEIRRLLIDTAREVFEERGYARATTREITARADVAETLLFRNFGSKANLFAEAVLRPLSEFFDDWVQRFAPAPPGQRVEVTQHDFGDSLYQMSVANRGLLLTFFATATFEPEVFAGQEAMATIRRSLDELAAATLHELERFGVDLRDYDVLIASRATVGMILSLALFESILLPQGAEARTRDELMHEVTRLTLFGGFNLRPASLVAPATPPLESIDSDAADGRPTPNRRSKRS